jgi:hypothetical protein
MLIAPGEKQQLVISNCSVSGFSFKTLLTANAVNVAALKSTVDLSLINVKATLHRMKGQFPLFNDLLLPLLLESAQNTEHFKLIHPGYTFFFPVQTQTAGLPGIGLIPGIIDLGGCINLEGDDRIVLEAYYPLSAVSGTGSTTATTLDMDFIEGIGVEALTPKIQSMTIQQGQTRLQASLGDNITKVTFVNIDQTAEGVATMPITSAMLSSDKLNYSDNNYEVINKNLFNKKWTTNDNLGLMMQVIELAPYQGVPYQKLNIDLSLDASLINNGKNFIVARQVYGDSRLLASAEAKKHKHQVRNLRDVFKSEFK